MTAAAMFENGGFQCTCPLRKREDAEGEKCRFRAAELERHVRGETGSGVRHRCLLIARSHGKICF